MNGQRKQGCALSLPDGCHKVVLRRGAYPAYGGKPLCLFGSGESCMLADHWDHFVFVRYSHRRNLLAMTESEAFRKGQHYRNAGLERMVIFMGEQAW
ncbi:MAG: hypothetical protein P8166_13775 [Candidatus Thiodiazotropha sp.]